ncbi:hypothetical protein D3H64_02945 [Atopobacter sp. AH10]|uniref:hypothetical protein n=1 Tax=Atopobacter sp. AH10 TaxID=2315861 RepID=UPI000EF26B0F|nr:hypothetical protein [Atopobacter sp. AH10]RLK63720.1 hypothetical protein D3H64_02945 [Atopobacter sp. AH10]
MKKLCFRLLTALILFVGFTPPLFAEKPTHYMPQTPIQQTVLELVVLVESESGFALPHQKVDLLDLEKEQLPIVASLRTDQEGCVRFNKENGLLYHHRYGIAINGQNYPLQVESETPTQWIEKVVLKEEEIVQKSKGKLLLAKEPVNEIRLQLIDTDLNPLKGQGVSLLADESSQELTTDQNGCVCFKTKAEDRKIYQICINGQASEYYTSNFSTMRLIFNKTLLDGSMKNSEGQKEPSTSETTQKEQESVAHHKPTLEKSQEGRNEKDNEKEPTTERMKESHADSIGSLEMNDPSLSRKNTSGASPQLPHIYKKSQNKNSQVSKEMAKNKENLSKVQDEEKINSKKEENLAREQKKQQKQEKGEKTDNSSTKEQDLSKEKNDTEDYNPSSPTDDIEDISSRPNPGISPMKTESQEKQKTDSKKHGLASTISRLLPKTGEKILRLSTIGLSLCAIGLILYTKTSKNKQKKEEKDDREVDTKTDEVKSFDLADDEWFLE